MTVAIRIAHGAFLALVVCAMNACGKGAAGDTFTNTTRSQTTVIGGASTTLALTGNTLSVTFPSNTFNHDTIVLISTELQPALAQDAGDKFLQYYPTASKAVGDLITGLVVNTPADALFHQDITAKFAFFNEQAFTPGDQYIIYRFDFDNLVWNRWGNNFATVDGGGRTATAILHTVGLRGFVGALALFKDMTTANQPAYAPSTLHFLAVDTAGNPIATDVGIYFLVGSTPFPADLPGARIPTGGTLHNTVDTGSDGQFTLTLPDYLVGQQINVEFGREDPNHKAQPEFNILAPVSPNVTDSRNFTRVRVITPHYGENNLQSQPISDSTGAELPLLIPADEV